MRPSCLKYVVRMFVSLTRGDGQSLVEYALLLALIAFGCAATMKSLASGISTEFTTVAAVLTGAM